MRLSTVFELLLIFLFLAFAASRTVHEKKRLKLSGKQATEAVDAAVAASEAPVPAATATQNRYCQCSHLMCNCCRDFSLPVVSLKGPGCATVAYVNEDSMRLTMTFGERVLRNITLAGKRPNPVCMPLPGGVSKFCGRVYGITRDGDHFKACLALELRSLEDLEAALRVSCFRFGPEGVKLEPGKPVPAAPTDEDDDDDDDDYGFSDSDEDDDDDDFGLGDDDDDDDDDEENDVAGGEEADYTGFSALSDEFLEGFFGGGSSSNKKPTTKPTAKPTQIVKATKKPVKKAGSTAQTVVTKATTPSQPKETTTKIVPTTQRIAETTAKIVETTVTKSSADVEMTPANEPSPSAEMSSTVVPENPTTATALKDEDYYGKDTDDDEEEDDDSEEENEGKISIIKKGEEEEDSQENQSNDVVGTVVTQERAGRVGHPIAPSGRGENLTPEETERLFPGLTALIRPPSYTSYAFPPARSARTHRRMRLPPV